MQNQLFAYVPEGERKRMLSDNCDRVEETEYLKAFDTDQLSEMKENLSTVSIDIDSVEIEKKLAVSGYSETLKSLNRQRKDLLENLRNKAERVEEPCYVFFDHDAKQVGIYNEVGTLVSSRPMRPGEFQKTVFSGLTKGDEFRTGTND